LKLYLCPLVAGNVKAWLDNKVSVIVCWRKLKESNCSRNTSGLLKCAISCPLAKEPGLLQSPFGARLPRSRRLLRPYGADRRRQRSHRVVTHHYPSGNAQTQPLKQSQAPRALSVGATLGGWRGDISLTRGLACPPTGHHPAIYGRPAGKLAEARRLVSDQRYSSISRVKAAYSRAPKARALLETTFLRGLRKAGMTED
jgi:hypothetical protein